MSLANLIVNKALSAGATWDALWRAFPSMRSQLQFGPAQINAPYNAITLATSIYTEFENFSTAFESTCLVRIVQRLSNPVRAPLGYITSVSTGGYQRTILPKSGTVTFRGTTKIPAHHPVLLEAQASVARILHMTAIGEQIEKVLRDREEVSCLASDGSTEMGYLLMAF